MGLVNQIDRMADEALQIGSRPSLHAPNDDVAARWSRSTGAGTWTRCWAVRRYIAKTNRARHV
ncbi:MAG: hypothetical protein R3A10_22835 [Caldilineaceae bacterium]